MVNKTPISAKTNQMIGGAAPSVYLTKLQQGAAITPARMDEILGSHLIDPATLRADGFEAFFAARSSALLKRIEDAMGKTATQEPEEGEAVEATDYEVEPVEA